MRFLVLCLRGAGQGGEGVLAIENPSPAQWKRSRSRSPWVPELGNAQFFISPSLHLVLRHYDVAGLKLTLGRMISFVFVCHSRCLAYCPFILLGPLWREKFKAGPFVAARVQTSHTANITLPEPKCTDHARVFAPLHEGLRLRPCPPRRRLTFAYPKETEQERVCAAMPTPFWLSKS